MIKEKISESRIGKTKGGDTECITEVCRGRKKKKREVEEEERWELSDLLLPQYLNRLSNTWNKTTEGFCGNLACTQPHTHRHTHVCMHARRDTNAPHAAEDN